MRCKHDLLYRNNNDQVDIFRCYWCEIKFKIFRIKRGKYGK